MYTKHKLFGAIFNIFSKSSVNNNQITFVLDDNGSFKGNLEFIKNELSKRGSFNYYYFNKNKPTVSSLSKLAKSKYIFLNDNLLAMAFMNFNKDTIITQLWHAPGAFKKFGASSSESQEEIATIKKANEKIDYLISSCDNISPYYEDAFKVDKSKIKSLGTPRIDYYFQNHDLNKLRNYFDSKFPQAKGKKIILYAPTFREIEANNDVFNFLDLKKFNERLGQDYILALRLHPKVKKFFGDEIDSCENFINVTDWENEQELLLLSDILITDYSSIMIEFAILNKPILFFAYDLDSYLNSERGFYFDFNENVPGKIVYSDDELIKAIEEEDFEKQKISGFLETQFNEIDGNASKRIVDFILNNEG